MRIVIGFAAAALIAAAVFGCQTLSVSDAVS